MTDESQLKPLTIIARKYPQIEAEVIWAKDGDWDAQSDETDGLDGEEIPYYAEGMLAEGYSLAWQVLGEDGTPEFVRLFFWQGAMPALPDDPDLISQGMIAV